jgi:hypothetical protein
MAFKMSDGLLFCSRFADELPQFAGITIKAVLMAFKMGDGLLFCGRFADEVPQFTGITIKAVMVSVTLFMLYVLWVYVTWIENNSGNVPRSQSGSPSNLRMPLPAGCPFRRDLRGEATEKIVRGVSLPAKSRAKGLTDR